MYGLKCGLPCFCVDGSTISIWQCTQIPVQLGVQLCAPIFTYLAGYLNLDSSCFYLLYQSQLHTYVYKFQTGKVHSNTCKVHTDAYLYILTLVHTNTHMILVLGLFATYVQWTLNHDRHSCLRRPIATTDCINIKC